MKYTDGGACVHVGDTINSDTTHIHVQVWLLLGAGNKATGSHGELYPSPQGTAGLSAEEAAPFSIPANGGKGLTFPPPCQHLLLSFLSNPPMTVLLDQGNTFT